VRVGQAENLKLLYFFQMEKKANKVSKLALGPGSLYAALPIPAYKALSAAGEHAANRVLTALVSHLGKGSNLAFPSMETIAKETGMNKTTVNNALKVLYSYGFVEKYKTKAGKHWRNNYLILPSAYQRSKFSSLAAKNEKRLGICKSCGYAVRRSDVGVWGEGEGYAHFGCGGLVSEFKKRRPKI
jgi:predicted transcriptional regulator